MWNKSLSKELAEFVNSEYASQTIYPAQKDIFRAFDLSNVSVASHNTSANPSLFEYSTNNGSSWLPLGTIPNTVGTLVRYTFTSPPGVPTRVSIRES